MLVGEEIEHALTVGQCHFITHRLLQGGGMGEGTVYMYIKQHLLLWF